MPQNKKNIVIIITRIVNDSGANPRYRATVYFKNEFIITKSKDTFLLSLKEARNSAMTNYGLDIYIENVKIELIHECS
jgi:hypothetical protein